MCWSIFEKKTKTASCSRTFHVLIQFSVGANCTLWFMALFCIASFPVWAPLLFSPFHFQPANKTRQYNHPPSWPQKLTACLLNTSKTPRSKSVFLFFPSSSPAPLSSASAQPSSLSPPACAAVALSESSEFPVHCSVSAWKHHRCRHLVSYKKKKGRKKKKSRECDGMKTSVMANKTLSLSHNISVTDYQTGDAQTQTHTNKYRTDKQKPERSCG